MPQARPARSWSHSKYRAGSNSPSGWSIRTPVTRRSREQLRQQLVNGGEHIRILDTKAGQAVDVEEPAVVDFVRCRPPVREPIRPALRGDRAEDRTTRDRRRAVERADRVLDVLQNLRRPRRQLPQPILRDDALAMPLGDPVRRRVRVRRHLLERRDDALELQQIRIRRAQMRGQLVEAGAIDARCLPRIDRQLHVEVPQQQPSVPELELQFATLEHAAVLIPRIGSSSLRRSSRFTGNQSMSKKRPARALGPFSRTSRHQGFVDVAIPMWFGTKSTMC